MMKIKLMMLLNRWINTILHYFGGRDKQNESFSAWGDLGVAAGSRPLGRRLLHQNLAEQKYHYFAYHGRQNNVKSRPSIDYATSMVLFFHFSIHL